MINGEPSIPFNIERGVRQGDPLSSTLFVLVMEVLAANILNDPQIKGIPLNEPNSIYIKFLQYADDSYREFNQIFNEDEIKQINKLVEWFLSAPNRNSSGFQVINLMRTKRAQYPMNEGGWNIWNITQRQAAQKLWMINQFIHASQTKSIVASHHKNPKSIKNNNNQPLSLAEWYNEIHKTDNTIPKTEFQQSLKLRGYSYEKLFENVLKIKDPKTKDMMFRFHARCLPLNYLHQKDCTLCNENLGKTHMAIFSLNARKH
ncbi:hypothetical protein ACTFIY_007388 [Dictyostelium cf. discoideum]